LGAAAWRRFASLCVNSPQTESILGIISLPCKKAPLSAADLLYNENCTAIPQINGKRPAHGAFGAGRAMKYEQVQPETAVIY
jgi:hypothetical protein